MDALAARRWVIHVEVANQQERAAAEQGLPEDATTDAETALKYLARYARGLVIRDERLLGVSEEAITFSYKDYRDGGQRKTMQLSPEEFIRRFLVHVLPYRMQHTRRFGFLATNRAPQNLEKIRGLLGIDTEGPRKAAEEPEDEENQAEEESVIERPRCPQCGEGKLVPGRERTRPTIRDILKMPFPPPETPWSPEPQPDFEFF